MKRLLLNILLLLIFPTAAAVNFGQMARKPSPTREREVAMPDKPAIENGSLPRVESAEEFAKIARVYHPGTELELPHAMFVIDRRDKNKIYYLNSQKYRYHKDFLLANYLVPRGADVFKPIYIDENRRFIVGTIAWQKSLGKYTWELWEGDLASAELINLTDQIINDSFYEKVAFKPNSTRQEDASAKLEIERVSQSDISRNQNYLALNTGVTIGRLHVIDKLDDTVEIGDNEILVLKELPISLPPVRGIIVAKPSTPLSHINILAKGLGRAECLYQGR